MLASLSMGPKGPAEIMHRIVEQTADHAISAALRRCEGRCSGRELLMIYAWAAAVTAVFYGRNRGLDADGTLDFLKDEEVFAFEVLCQADKNKARLSLQDFDALYWDLTGRVLESVDLIFEGFEGAEDISDAVIEPIQAFCATCYDDFVPVPAARMDRDLISFFILLVSGETIRASLQALEEA